MVSWVFHTIDWWWCNLIQKKRNEIKASKKNTKYKMVTILSLSKSKLTSLTSRLSTINNNNNNNIIMRRWQWQWIQWWYGWWQIVKWVWKYNCIEKGKRVGTLVSLLILCKYKCHCCCCCRVPYNNIYNLANRVDFAEIRNTWHMNVCVTYINIKI